MIETIKASDLPTRWTEIFAALRAGVREYRIVEGQSSVMVIDSDRYQKLVDSSQREERRRRTLRIPLTGAESEQTWDDGFSALDRISQRFSGLSDDDLDDVFGEALANVRQASA